LRAAIQAALAAEGETALSRRLGLSPMAIMHMAAGQPVRMATAVVAAQRLGVDVDGGTP
jgi:hypothetical protein